MHLLEMEGITKQFGAVTANQGVNLSVRQGEIHALLGENGAGKTTLMNILYGLYQPDTGVIRYKEESVHVDGPNRAIALGIGMVHQHFMLVPPFTVAENIVLGQEPRRAAGRLDRARANELVEELSRRYGLHVDPRARVDSISVGQQQRVEILKALYRGAELLILDEPTAVLTPQEVVELGQILRTLVDQGRTIIFITHKLKEVLRIADRVTVMRGGRVVDTLETKGTSEEELARLMVGREVSLTVEKSPATPAPLPLLRVSRLECRNNQGLPAVRGIDLEVRPGEILGIGGVDGNGQTELIECITGLRQPTAGQIMIGEIDVTKLPVAGRSDLGLRHIPEDRHKRGLVLDFTVAENELLGRHRQAPFSRRGWISWKRVHAMAERLASEFDVRPENPRLSTRSLSGGNQQKAVLAREIDQKPRILLAVQPTRGVDVGAIEFIHKRLVAERDRGAAVLLVSLELDELCALSDRIAVIYEGGIVAEFQGDQATEAELGFYMAGGGSGGKPEAQPAS